MLAKHGKDLKIDWRRVLQRHEELFAHETKTSMHSVPFYQHYMALALCAEELEQAQARIAELEAAQTKATEL